MPYYGPGNSSGEGNRTNYLREDNIGGIRAGYKPFHNYLFFGMLAAVQRFNVGPGTSSSYPSTEQLFTPEQTPGLDRQAYYVPVGPFMTIDYTDDSNNPRSGGRYEFRYLWFHDYRFDRYSFRKVQTSAEQYIPFLNKKRIVAIRARSEWNLTDDGDQVPFYLQAFLGGPNDLRGYRQFRFYDNNSLLFNGEYRYEVTNRMDLAVFTDWGKVFTRPGQMALSEMHGTAGVGIRWRSGGPNMMRFDVGFGPGGVKFWFSFNDIFQGYWRSSLY
jgi:outer membrane protein assembly factor BamA